MIKEDKQEILKNMGVKDSKLLTEKKREFLFDMLPEHVEHKILIIPPAEIDKYVLGKNGENLNWLEADQSVEIVNIMNPDRAIIDSPSPNTCAYKEYIAERLLHKKVELIVENKADVNHPIAAAASIFAKVIRDREIAKIKQEVGEDFGSGYMSDPKTKAFLQKAWKTHSHIFRKSWAPYAKLAQQQGQKGLGEF